MNESKKEAKQSYNQILKATGIFGFVKIFTVLINLFKSKIIAIFLGAEGMGIFGLLNYPINLAVQLFGLGINTSAIPEVAKHKNNEELSETLYVIKKWNRITGLAGTIIVFLFASIISEWSFGNDSYSWAFRILSSIVIITSIGSEYEVILRGLRQIKLLAQAGFLSALAGFILSIPFYYFFGIYGIIAVIFIGALSLSIINFLYAKRIRPKSSKIPLIEVYHRGKNMVAMGIFVVLGDLIFIVAITAVNVFIRNGGGVQDVGLFQACNQITQSSINIVLMAMAADFFPRLSQHKGDWGKMREIATQQAEVAILLSTPIIVGIIIFAPLIITLLLSKDFLSITDAISWFLFGTIFRISSWAINYVLLANGSTKWYVVNVILNNSMLVPLYCFGYMLDGITGIGKSYVILMILYSIIQYLIVYKKFKFKFYSSFFRLFGVALVLSLFALFISDNKENSFIIYFLQGTIILSSLLFSVYYINKKTSLGEKIKQKLLKS